MAGTTHRLEKSPGPTFCPQRVSFVRLGVLAIGDLESPWNSDASIGSYRHRKTSKGPCPKDIVHQKAFLEESRAGWRESGK